MSVLLAVAVLASFTLSAAAGMGGSLILVPVLGIALGPKTGIAVAALLLACNNVGKVFAYRKDIPWWNALWLIILTTAGAVLGANLLVDAPEQWVAIAIVVSVVSTYLLERWPIRRSSRIFSSVLGFFAGATSGFSGTSGPLKGLALRSLGLTRQQLVAAASVVSLAGDAARVAVYAEAELLPREVTVWGLLAVPLMVAGVWFGRRCNRWLGERFYAWLFWAVMGGYSARLLVGF